MFEKVNPSHPDKIADRIAGAIVDLACKKQDNPKIAVEVLIGHGVCTVISETSVSFANEEIEGIVNRIIGHNHSHISVIYKEAQQDEKLSENQKNGIRCGDNGIFKGCPITKEQHDLTNIVRGLYSIYRSDGKYVINGKDITACQSKSEEGHITSLLGDFTVKENPLGYWDGGIDVDCGATNRKLGSDMGDAVTGGGLHGKDLSKADVSVNIYAHILAQKIDGQVELCCSIGDESINGVPYSEIVKLAKDYVDSLGGFEKLAEWGLIR